MSENTKYELTNNLKKITLCISGKIENELKHKSPKQESIFISVFKTIFPTLYYP